jgi:hypothetical protein
MGAITSPTFCRLPFDSSRDGLSKTTPNRSTD